MPNASAHTYEYETGIAMPMPMPMLMPMPMPVPVPMDGRMDGWMDGWMDVYEETRASPLQTAHHLNGRGFYVGFVRPNFTRNNTYIHTCMHACVAKRSRSIPFVACCVALRVV